MTERTDARRPPYTEASRRTSRNVLSLLLGLIGFATIVFGLLHAFGSRFGVPV